MWIVMIKTLAIEGLRGFSAKQEIKFSIPDGSNVGSGLNIIVGPNNTGKSTIVEAINAFNGQCSFSEGKRNTNSKSGVILELVDENNNNYEISTIKDGGSEADRLINGKSNSVILNNYILPSRRFVEYEFGGYKGDKKDYIRQNLFGNRKASLNSFSSRLFNMQKNKDKLNGFLGKTAIHPSQLKVIQKSMIINKYDYLDALSIIGINENATGVKKSIEKNRMNEVKTHRAWARKTIGLANIYGVAEDM